MEWGWPQWFMAFYMAMMSIRLISHRAKFDDAVNNPSAFIAWALLVILNFMVIVALHKGGFW